MEQKELIVRRKDENNKKFYKIFLTEKAIEIIDKLSKAELEWSRMIYSQIASNEKDAREILKSLTINALNFTDKERNK